MELHRLLVYPDSFNYFTKSVPADEVDKFLADNPAWGKTKKEVLVRGRSEALRLSEQYMAQACWLTTEIGD